MRYLPPELWSEILVFLSIFDIQNLKKIKHLKIDALVEQLPAGTICADFRRLLRLQKKQFVDMIRKYRPKFKEIVYTSYTPFYMPLIAETVSFEIGLEGWKPIPCHKDLRIDKIYFWIRGDVEDMIVPSLFTTTSTTHLFLEVRRDGKFFKEENTEFIMSQIRAMRISGAYWRAKQPVQVTFHGRNARCACDHDPSCFARTHIIYKIETM